MRYLPFVFLIVLLYGGHTFGQETDDRFDNDPAVFSEDTLDMSVDIITYPNPTDGMVIISSINVMDENELSLQIRDLKGQLIKEVNYIGNKIQPLRLTLDLSSFTRGTYFYTLYDDKAVVTKGKIIRK